LPINNFFAKNLYSKTLHTSPASFIKFGGLSVKNSYPIVGAFYRRAGQAVLGVYPLRGPLTLIAETNNPADENAIAVWAHTAEIRPASYEFLTEGLEQAGLTLDEFLEEAYWHVGYIPRHIAAELRLNNIVTPDANATGIFDLSPEGQPRFRFTSD